MNSQPLIDFGSAPFDIIDGDRGKNYPKQDEFHETGHCLFLSATNVTSNGFDFSNAQFITEQKDSLLRKGKLKREDVVLTTRGTIGNVGYYNGSVPFDNLRINSGMVIFRCELNKLLPAYLYHFLRSSQFHGQVNSLKSGVAQPQLPIRDMKHIKMPISRIDKQKIILDILSTYDNLIENNQRRIQLLEKSARLLYKEWFVHLRFPGHEHVKIEDGVPEGWQKNAIGDIAPLHYGKALKKEDRLPGSIPVFGSSGIIGTHEKPLINGPAIIVGRKGNVGSIYWSESDFYPIDTVYYIEAKNCSLYLYYALQYIQFINTDVAVPGLNRDFAHSREILFPDNIIFDQFKMSIGPVRAQINNLTKYNETLIKARDLLLPKLMNGEIPV